VVGGEGLGGTLVGGGGGGYLGGPQGETNVREKKNRADSDRHLRLGTELRMKPWKNSLYHYLLGG